MEEICFRQLLEDKYKEIINIAKIKAFKYNLNYADLLSFFNEKFIKQIDKVPYGAKKLFFYLVYQLMDRSAMDLIRNERSCFRSGGSLDELLECNRLYPTSHQSDNLPIDERILIRNMVEFLVSKHKKHRVVNIIKAYFLNYMSVIEISKQTGETQHAVQGVIRRCRCMLRLKYSSVYIELQT